MALERPGEAVDGKYKKYPSSPFLVPFYIVPFYGSCKKATTAVNLLQARYHYWTRHWKIFAKLLHSLNNILFGTPLFPRAGA